MDYLTDANSDGVYELLDGQDDPICDVVTADGRLTAWDGVDHRLEEGQIFALPADLLASRGQAVLQGRLAAGQEDVDPDHLIYLLSLSYVPAGGGEPQTLHYYLQLFQSVIIPSDVPVGSWYYEAVEYGLAQGFFSGTGEDSFSPQGTVTRAQLAQILWRLGGSEEGREVSFTDVSSGDWFLDAACWCAQEGVMSGVGDQRFGPNQVLSREQLALILYQYARRTGLQMEGGRLWRCLPTVPLPPPGHGRPWAGLWTISCCPVMRMVPSIPDRASPVRNWLWLCIASVRISWSFDLSHNGPGRFSGRVRALFSLCG